jgi:hypothetical protein
MSRPHQSLADWLHRYIDASVTSAGAPDGLRRRVLAKVRSGVDPPDASCGLEPRTRAWSRLAIAAVTAIVAGVAIAVTFALEHSTERDEVKLTAGIQGAHASLHRVGTRAELQVSGMPQPPIGEVYEVWLDRPGTRPQATDSLFTVTNSGSASVDVPGGLHGVQDVMVTTEPLGGSMSPTSLAALRVFVARGR